MIPARVVAGLASFVGICMIAGWLSAFRNRSYLGWLGLAFVTFGGSLMAADKVETAQALGAASSQFAVVGQTLLAASALSFLLALFAAIRETRRRLRELQQRHREAAEAMIELTRALHEKEGEGQPDSGDEKPPPDGGQT